MKNNPILTSDGSQTLYSERFKEHYHSIHGAKNESQHVFLQNGFYDFLNEKEIYILEMGMGTGLNAWLTLKEAVKNKVSVSYVTYEQFPISMEEVSSLSYIGETEKNLFNSIHQSEWNVPVPLNDYFTLEKRNQDMQSLEEISKYNLVYYDAFAPNCQPELWTTDIFRKIYTSMKEEGILVTYCAKGYVKRNLKEAGFEVKSLPGPPRKREMTKAIKRR